MDSAVDGLGLVVLTNPDLGASSVATVAVVGGFTGCADREDGIDLILAQGVVVSDDQAPDLGEVRELE